MKFETEHGCVVSETVTAYGNFKTDRKICNCGGNE